MSASLPTQFPARYDPALLPNTRRFGKALALLAALAFPVVSSAGTYTVTSNADTGDSGTLRWAIEQANADAGSTITFNPGLSPIVLTSALPMITAAVTINGGAGATVSGNQLYRVFFVNTVSAGDAVKFQNLIIADGYAKGGNGGAAAGGGLGAGAAIFVNIGAVQVSGVAFTGNAAQGGNGGNGVLEGLNGNPASGGGGGLGGDGGNGTGYAGGGGGGYQGDGGSSDANGLLGAAGGGGIYGNGGNNSGSDGGAGGGTTNAQGTTPGTGGGNAATVRGESGGAGGYGGGGGGGAGWTEFHYPPDGGSGGFGGGGGGATIDAFASGGRGGDGGDLGGGGGSPGTDDRAGQGGFGGGGGGGSANNSDGGISSRGGIGGFGAGGGGSTLKLNGGGNPGTYGGRGGGYTASTNPPNFVGTAGGGGGAGLGGAIFVRSGNGASLEFVGGTESLSSVTRGLAGSSPPANPWTTFVAPDHGQALGSGIFLPTGNSNFHGGTIGDIAGTGGAVLSKVGTGTMTMLGGLNVQTTITTGAISIGNGGTTGSLSGNVTNNASLIFNRSDNGPVYGGSLTGTGTVTKIGAGTVTFAGDNSQYNGSLAIDEGVLALNGGGNPSNRVLDTTINAGGTLRLLEHNQIGTSTITVNGGTFDFNGKTDYFAALVMKNGGTVNGGGMFTLESTGSPLLSTTGGGHAGTIATTFGITSQYGIGGDADRTVQIDAAAATSLTISGAIRDTLEGAAHVGSLNKTGTGTVVLSGANTYTGATSVNGGILLFASPSAFYGGTIDPATAGRLAVASGATAAFSVGGTGEFNSTHLDTLRASGGFASGGSPGFDTTNASEGAFTYASNIDGSIGIAKLGAGALVLTGSNDFTGPVTLNGGTLSLGSAGAIGTLGSISFGGGTLQYTAANTTDYSSRFSAAAGQQYRIDTNGQSVILASALTSSGGTFEKLGAGTATLPAHNTYTGATTVSAGTLALTGTAASSAFAIASGAVLELNSTSGNRDMAGSTTFSGTGTLRKTGSGGGVFWGSSSATFALGSGSLIDVQSGTLVGGSNANEVWTANLSNLNVEAGATFWGAEANVRVSALSGSGTIRSGYSSAGYATFTFGVNDGSGTFAGIMADTDTGAGHLGSFTKTGTGTQILSGANTYTGTTVIHNGTLAFTGTMTGTGALTVDSGGTLAGTSALPMPVTVQSGGTIAPGNNGPATLALSGAVSLNSGCKLNFELGTLSDKLALNGSYTPPAGGAVVVNVAALAGFRDGTYPLITGAAGISAGSFSLGAVPPGDSYSLTAAAGTLSLIVGPLSSPSGLAAVAGTAQVSLTWSPAENATGYNVKRSTQAGGPYTVIAANVPGPGHADTGLTNGTRYYYVVSALYSGAESPDSAEVSALPLAPLDPAELLAPTLVRDGNLMHLSTASSSLGRSYQLQRSLTLDGNSWENIGEAIPGSGAGLTFDDSTPAQAERCFFRIVILP